MVHKYNRYSFLVVEMTLYTECGGTIMDGATNVVVSGLLCSIVDLHLRHCTGDSRSLLPDSHHRSLIPAPFERANPFHL